MYIYIFTWLWIFKWIFDIRYFGKYSLDLGRFHGDQMRIWFCVMSLLSHQGGWSPIRLSISNEWMEDDPACQVYINIFIQYNPKWIPWYHILNGHGNDIQYNGNDIQYHLMGDPFYIKPRWVRNFHAWWDDHHLLKLLVTSGDHCIKTLKLR